MTSVNVRCRCHGRTAQVDLKTRTVNYTGKPLPWGSGGSVSRDVCPILEALSLLEETGKGVISKDERLEVL